MTADQSALALLRKPFPDHQVSKLPKESKVQADERKANRGVGVNCRICGGWHHKNAVHLDYVGHAALTDRLLDTDPAWFWEPLASNSDGLPALDRNGGLWIKLTVCGVSRLGYGAADGKSGGDAIKEIIGDALRNAAMRFGAALDLWHKGDLHLEDDAAPAVENKPAAAPQHEPEARSGRQQPERLTGKHKTRAAARTAYGEIVRELHACDDEDQLRAYLDTIKDDVAQFRDELPSAWKGDGHDFIGLEAELDNAFKRVRDEREGQAMVGRIRAG